MKNPKQGILTNVIVFISVLVIVLCFSTSLFVVESYAKKDCFEHIEEATAQICDMFHHAIRQSMNQLELFAGILAANSSNPEDLLQVYMENFCETQNFSAVCIHRADGTSVSYGAHPHADLPRTFEKEVEALPYVSDRHISGEKRSEQYIYLAVPVVRSSRTVAVLYGYISLETFPTFISSTTYGGKCEFYIVDGNTGDFLMDEYHRTDGSSPDEIPLGNVFGGMGSQETKPGYSLESMYESMRQGESGYFVFKSQQTGQWHYTYFMPMGINNWSMQVTIDEPTAFETYYDVRDTAFALITAVVFLCLVVIVVLMLQSRRRLAQEKQRLEQEKKNLHKSEYTNAVQAALISAHNNPDFVAQALKLAAGELQAETALLLVFSDKTIRDVYFWPSVDKYQAMTLRGKDIRDEFPSLFDAVVANETVFCGEEEIAAFSPATKEFFEAFDIRNLLVVPVADNSGIYKGAIVTVNMHGDVKNAEMLKCVTRDFYMAITNLESLNIIKRMGAIDYMTGVKNRNSYEAELVEYETLEAENLWCIFVDANGLHELNNSKGHKAGDQMLCAVANGIKRLFGPDHTYRLGGDEFVAFRANSTHDEMMNFKYRLLDTLERKGYSVSVGFEGTSKNENNIFDVEKVTGAAETIMYQEKWKYYEKNGISTERKYFPPDSMGAQRP